MKVPLNFEKPPLFHSGSRAGEEISKPLNFSGLPALKDSIAGSFHSDYKVSKTESELLSNGENEVPLVKRAKIVEEGQLPQIRLPVQCRMSSLPSLFGHDFSIAQHPHEECQRSGNRLIATTEVQASQFNPLNEPSPLGLSLRKSPSLLDLIQRKLTQSEDMGPQCSDDANQDFNASRTGTGISATGAEKDKLKAANFPASFLRIGTWECTSRYDGDLVAKCYYAKRKLVWEVLDTGLKSKMEIQWSDISALKASFPEDHPAVLDLELSRPPLFFREINPQPRKHTLWQSASDFTDGQATICRHHSVQFPVGVLNRHFEKLLQCDVRLMALNDQRRAITDSLFFENQSMHMNRQHMLNYPSVLSEQTALHPLAIEGFKSDPASGKSVVESIQNHITMEGVKNEPLQHVASVHSTVERVERSLKHEPLQHGTPVPRDLLYAAPVTGILQPERGLRMQFSNVASPSSVIDVTGMDESSSSSEADDMQPKEDASGHALDDQMHSIVSPVDSRPFPMLMAGSLRQMNEWPSSLPPESSMKRKLDGAVSSLSIQASEKQVLNELSLQLLGEPISLTDQHAYKLGPVNASPLPSRASYEVLANIARPLQASISSSFMDACRDLVHTHDRQVGSLRHGLLGNEDSKACPRFGENSWNPMLNNLVNSSFEASTSTLTSHGSCVDLVYLPRIASLPQFLEPAP